MGKEKQKQTKKKENNKNKTKPRFEKKSMNKMFFIFDFTYVHQISQKSVDK